MSDVKKRTKRNRSMKKIVKRFGAIAALATVFALPALVVAGTGGTEFDPVWNLITDWSQGALGRVIAGIMILVGLVAGVGRQSIMALAVGVGGGVGIFYAPTVLDSVVSGALPVL
jgi:conjugal transfer pilus assembly protein TraA